MKTDNATTCLLQFIKLLKIPLTGNSIYKELEKHPDHPSLLSLSDVLNNWQIPNGAFQINAKELTAIPAPFIAHLSTNGGEFTVIESLDEEYISISNESWHKRKLTVEEFSKFYTGHILIAQSTPETGEQDYHIKRRKEIIQKLRLPFVVTGFIALTVALLFRSSYFGIFSWQVALLTFAKCTGLITSVLLLIQSVDSSNPMIQRLCTGGKRINCNAILSSKAAKITEEISWSEIGFFTLLELG